MDNMHAGILALHLTEILQLTSVRSAAFTPLHLAETKRMEFQRMLFSVRTLKRRDRRAPVGESALAALTFISFNHLDPANAKRNFRRRASTGYECCCRHPGGHSHLTPTIHRLIGRDRTISSTPINRLR